MNNLSERLQTIANLVIPGEAVADIGTDHGFIPMHLLAENVVPFVVLADVNEGPLEAAKAHMQEAQFNPDFYSLRIGDGLKTLEKGEVSSIIIAGMGGELIQAILDEDLEKSKSYKRFILQPRTHASELRYYLSTHGFEFEDYKLVKEKFRICEIFVVKPSIAPLEADTSLISKFLLSRNEPLIKEFVDYKIKSAGTVLASLEKSNTEDGEAQKQVFIEILEELKKIRESL